MSPDRLRPERVAGTERCVWWLRPELSAVGRAVAGPCERHSAAGRLSKMPHARGARAGYDGYKRRKGSKIYMAVDTLGHLLALKVTPANEQERAQVASLAEDVQEITGENMQVAFVDQGYTGEETAKQAAKHGIRLEVVKLEEAKRGFVLLPRRWVVERSFGWAARFRKFARDYERLAPTLAGLHWLAFISLMLNLAFKSS